MYWQERFQDDPGYSQELVSACERAAECSARRGLLHFGLTTLVSGMIESRDSLAARALESCGAQLEQLQSLIASLPFSADMEKPPETVYDSLFVSTVLSEASREARQRGDCCDTGYVLLSAAQRAQLHKGTMGGHTEAGDLCHVLWQVGISDVQGLSEAVTDLRPLFPET